MLRHPGGVYSSEGFKSAVIVWRHGKRVLQNCFTIDVGTIQKTILTRHGEKRPHSKIYTVRLLDKSSLGEVPF